MARKSSPPGSSLRRFIKRWLLTALLAVPIAAVALFVAVHKVEWLGPLIANSLRAVVGSERVARLEELAYGAEDRFNRYWRKDEKPKAYWVVPTESARPVSKVGPAAVAPSFHPSDVGPMHKSWAAPGDGEWVAIHDPRRPNDEPYLYKTLLHPDQNRSWAEVFLVAVDLKRVRVHAMAGSHEPKSLEKDARDYKRLARIPDADQDTVLGAFNGSYMTEHGSYGMKVDGVTLIKSRERSCTIAGYKDNTVRINSWPKLADGEADMVWFRQGPSCMVEEGKLHPGLVVEGSTNWGATVDGETVIRRSAVGIDQKGEILYVGITNHTTARAIATAMQFAGAHTVAQLDVNWSYPKFVLFEPDPGSSVRKAVPLAKGFELSEDEYIRKRSGRDFFYLTPKKSETARN